MEERVAVTVVELHFLDGMVGPLEQGVRSPESPRGDLKKGQLLRVGKVEIRGAHKAPIAATLQPVTSSVLGLAGKLCEFLSHTGHLSGELRTVTVRPSGENRVTTGK